jgi:hypothetical protein
MSEGEMEGTGRLPESREGGADETRKQEGVGENGGMGRSGGERRKGRQVEEKRRKECRKVKDGR